MGSLSFRVLYLAVKEPMLITMNICGQELEYKAWAVLSMFWDFREWERGREREDWEKDETNKQRKKKNELRLPD